MGRRWILGPVLLLALLLSACASPDDLVVTPPPAPSPSPTATPAPVPFALAYYPAGGFHPITGSNRTNLQLSPLIYEGLFALDEAGAPQPVLCQNWQAAEDGLSWMFTVRAVSFSDGSPITAEDVAYSLNLARTSSSYSARLAGITQITAEEEGQVTVSLSSPNGVLPTLLDVPIIRENGDIPLGTGPYVPSYDGEDWSLAASPHWWQDQPLPTAYIPLRTIQEADDLIYAFDTKDISLVGADLTATNALGYSGSYETLDYPTTTMLYVGFNTRRGVCQDAAVRRALSRDLDRSTAATVLLARHAVEAALPFPPGSSYYEQELARGLGYDPQQAQLLLAEAGWVLEEGRMTRGKQVMSLTFVVNQDNTYRMSIAELLATSLSNLGIQVTVEKLPWDEYVSALERGAFDLYLAESRLTADLDLRPLLRDAGALNFGGYADPETTRLQERYQAASGTARVSAARLLAEDFVDKAPFAVLCFKNWSLLTQWGQIEGATPTQQNLFYGFSNWTIH